MLSRPVKEIFVKRDISCYWPVRWKLIQGGGLNLSGNIRSHSSHTLVVSFCCLRRSGNMEIDENASERFRWLRVNWKWGTIKNVKIGIFLRFNPVVTFLSAAIIWFFVIWCAVQADVANREMSKWMLWITEVFTWMYIGTQDVWFLFIIVLYFSKYGKMKLGKPDDKPDFNDLTYFTMLFAAGIGIGLFYFGVGKSLSLRYSSLNLAYLSTGEHSYRCSRFTLAIKGMQCYEIIY